MKLYVVTADNHDYDAMSQWTVGAYTTKRKANNAAARARKAYGKKTYLPLNITITPLIVDKDTTAETEEEYA